MDKHMIHIDEAVRQKLRDREEPERPGAWLTMRELLDKEMPAVVGAAFNWRRLLGYITSLVLITTAGVGAYKFASQHDADAARLAPTNSATFSANIPTIDVPAVATSDNTISQPHAIAVTGPAKTTGRLVRTDPATTQTSADDTRNSAASRVRISSVALANSIESQAAPLASASAQPGALSNSAMNSLNADKPLVGSSDDRAVSENAVASLSGATVRSRAVLRSSAPLQSRNHLPLNSASTNTTSLMPVNVSATATVQPKPVRFVLDTIQRLEIVYHRAYDPNTEKFQFRLDTFPLSAMIVPRPVFERVKEETVAGVAGPIAETRSSRRNARHTAIAANVNATTRSDGASALNAKPQIAPAASPDPATQSAAVAEADKAELVSLSKLKVGTKHFRLFDANKVTAMIEHAKASLAKVQIYPGMMGGINASIFTSNSLGGGQFGFTTLVALNEWWTVMTELKYFHRFNTGSTLRDNYLNISDTSVQYVQINNQSYKQYSWKQDTVDHYFNYDVIRTLELPVALRYNWGRFYAMAGVNLVYSLAIKSAEVTRAHNNPVSKMENRPATHNDQEFTRNNAPLVRMSDFGARFGTGYLIGGGYQFSPGVYVDLRLAQQFWDNAGTAGAKQVSDNLLQSPSFQLSVGYRFSRKH